MGGVGGCPRVGTSVEDRPVREGEGLVRAAKLGRGQVGRDRIRGQRVRPPAERPPGGAPAQLGQGRLGTRGALGSPSGRGAPEGKLQGSRALLVVPHAQGRGTGGWLSSGAGQGNGEGTGHVSPGVWGSAGPARLQGSHLQDPTAQHPGGGMAPGITTPRPDRPRRAKARQATPQSLGFCSGETQSQAPPRPTVPGSKKHRAARDGARSCHQGPSPAPASGDSQRAERRPQNLCDKFGATRASPSLSSPGSHL